MGEGEAVLGKDSHFKEKPGSQEGGHHSALGQGVPL